MTVSPIGKEAPGSAGARKMLLLQALSEAGSEKQPCTLQKGSPEKQSLSTGCRVGNAGGGFYSVPPERLAGQYAFPKLTQASGFAGGPTARPGAQGKKSVYPHGDDYFKKG